MKKIVWMLVITVVFIGLATLPLPVIASTDNDLKTYQQPCIAAERINDGSTVLSLTGIGSWADEEAGTFPAADNTTTPQTTTPPKSSSDFWTMFPTPVWLIFGAVAGVLVMLIVVMLAAPKKKRPAGAQPGGQSMKNRPGMPQDMRQQQRQPMQQPPMQGPMAGPHPGQPDQTDPMAFMQGQPTQPRPMPGQPMQQQPMQGQPMQQQFQPQQQPMQQQPMQGQPMQQQFQPQQQPMQQQPMQGQPIQQQFQPQQQPMQGQPMQQQFQPQQQPMQGQPMQQQFQPQQQPMQQRPVQPQPMQGQPMQQQFQQQPMQPRPVQPQPMQGQPMQQQFQQQPMQPRPVQPQPMQQFPQGQQPMQPRSMQPQPAQGQFQQQPMQQFPQQQSQQHPFAAQPGGQMPYSAPFRSSTPPSFALSNLIISPDNVKEGDPVTISAVVTNTGASSGQYSLVLRINSVVEKVNDLNINPGSNQTSTFTIVRDMAGEYYIELDGLRGMFVVTTRKPPAFSISNLTIAPERVKQGEPIAISAVVTNSGETMGNYSVVLRVKGVAEGIEEVNLEPGRSQRVTFNITKDTAGFYPVTLENMTGKFVVEMDWRE